MLPDHPCPPPLAPPAPPAPLPPSEDFALLQALQTTLLELQASTRVELKGLRARVELLEAKAKDEELGDEENEKGGEAALGFLTPGRTQAMEYGLNSTTWDAPAVVGLPQLGGRAPSCLLCLAIFINTAAQIFLVFFMENSGAFIAPHKWQNARVAAQRWRANEGHEYSSLDASGSSLASRVCGMDNSLSVAGKQAGKLGEINAYLGLAEYSTEEKRVATGPMLCSVCLFIFVVVILKDVRETMSFWFAVFAVPRGRTRIEGDELVAISRGRLTCISIMNVVRIMISISLLYTGIMWLSATSSITDLILNAAALHFVMDLDELIFASIVPDVAQKILGELKPLPYKMPRLYFEAVLPLILTVVIVSTSVTQVVLPAAYEMLEVKKEICGGNLDFVVAESSTGIIVTTPTLPYWYQLTANSTQLALATVKMRAVDELRRAEPSLLSSVMNYSVHTSDRENFLAHLQSTIDSVSSEVPCHDLDTWSSGIALSESPAWFTTISLELIGAETSWQPHAWRCADFKANCSHSSLLRLVCSVTCGCDNPASGLILKNKGSGCPTLCRSKNAAVLAGQPCVDANVANTPAWTTWWRTWAALFRKSLPKKGSEPSFLAFVERKIAQGCANVEGDPLTGASFCDDTAPMVVSSGMETIQGFCTKSCCSALPRSANCPATCA